jgi:hypothetical protein
MKGKRSITFSNYPFIILFNNNLLEKAVLYFEERPDIKISMELYFNKEGQLFFDGYDIGETVKKIWGDTDYEYTYTIAATEANKFYNIFSIPKGHQPDLLQVFKKMFSVNEAYTLFGEFMDKHGIKYERHTWA